MAQTRDRLLVAAAPWDELRVAGEQTRKQMIRETAAGVLPANGDEAGNAAELLRAEEAAHGNDVQALSIDGIGFQGSVLRELEDPQGLSVEVHVPPKKEPPPTTFPPEAFVEDRAAEELTCPAGQTASSRERNERDTAWVYRFSVATCATCPLRSQCLARGAAAKSGRKVHKNAYEAEYRRARQWATTAAYRAARAEHPRIERKLSELTRWHGARRARYRGRWKVLCQALLTATVVNVKRLMHLLCAPAVAGAGT